MVFNFALIIIIEKKQSIIVVLSFLFFRVLLLVQSYIRFDGDLYFYFLIENIYLNQMNYVQLDKLTIMVKIN